MQKKVTFKDFVNDITNDVAKEILKNKDVAFNVAKKEFVSSKTYRLLKEHGRDYYHEGPLFFYNLWSNEQRVGEPISTEELELTKSGQQLLSKVIN